MTDPRRLIPGVDQLLSQPGARELLARYPRVRVTRALRVVLDEVRRGLADTPPSSDTPSTSDPAAPAPYLEAARLRLEAEDLPSLRPVVNATGVVLHTNLGRAPLAPAALEAMTRIGAGYGNLEFDLEEGTRGSRYVHCAGLLAELTGAEDALVVNNCAAGLILAVSALSHGRDVVVSRGELVEIGGGFRIPEILVQAGAGRREVGATNRTRIDDYRAAVRAGGTGALLKVHRSNFRMAGFTEEASLAELVALGREVDLPVIYDLGSGLMVDASELGLPPEPRPLDGVAAGADLVIFSGDKLLGGPQAGLVVGRSRYVERLRRAPLCRALRVDKATLAALEATLALYRDPVRPLAEIPALALLAASLDGLETRARALAGAVQPPTPVRVRAVRGEARVGGGTYPEAPIPTWQVRVEEAPGGAGALARALRGADPPVVGRIVDDALVLDLRSVSPDLDEAVERALARVLDPAR